MLKPLFQRDLDYPDINVGAIKILLIMSFGNEPVDLHATGLRPKLKYTWNLIVRPELELENIKVQDFDALAIAGGFEKAGFYEDAFDERLLNLIREFSLHLLSSG